MIKKRLPVLHAHPSTTPRLNLILTVVAVAVWATSLAGCSRSSFIRIPFDDATPQQVSRPLSAAEAREDLDELLALVEEATPRPFLYRSREHVRSEFERLSGGLPASLTRREFAGVLREASAAFGIGHQYAISPHEDFNTWADAGGRSPTFTVRAVDDRLLIVRGGPPGLVPAARIVQLNGRPADALLATLRSRTSADTPAQRDDLIGHQFELRLWELGLEAPYDVVAQPPGGDLVQVQDAGRRPEPRVSMFAARSRSVPAHGAGREPNFRLDWVTPTIARIRWNSMDPREEQEWQEFLIQSAAELDQKRAQGLVIDIRDNGGGTGSLAAPLLGMISDTPWRMSGGKLWRKSKPYDQFLESCVVWWARPLGWRTFFSSDYAKMSLGEERLISAAAAEPSRFKGTRFSGPVCVLIGPRTFSSAVMFADAVSTYKLATLVGQPTGGVPNSHGEIGFQRLRRSGLLVSFCSAQFVRASGDAQDSSPVRPDVSVDGAPASDADPALDAAIRIIESANR